MIFELLCVDTHEEVKSKTIGKIILSLQSDDNLWCCETSVSTTGIETQDTKIAVSVESFDTSKMAMGNRNVPAYIFKVSSVEFSIIEPFRMKLIDHLKDMKFSYISILFDDVSNDIALRLYPFVNRIENKMRNFITIALVQKIGEDFLKVVVPSETLNVAKGNKKNEPHFINSGKVQNDITMLYFDALGNIVYGDSIFSKAKPSAILEKVKIATDLKQLQKELLEGHFQKYFTDCFVKAEFASKWQRLNEIRNKVAHNSFFLESEYEECKVLYEEICAIIDNAFANIDKITLSLDDMATIKAAVDESIVEENTRISKNETKRPDTDTLTPSEKTQGAIDEQTLIATLKEIAATHPFVGLKHFANTVLGNNGYSLDSIWAQINILIDQGIIETYKEDNPRGEFPTTAIRLS